MISDGNHLVLFPTVAYRDQELNSWIANVHGWCFDAEENSNFQRATAGILRRALKLPGEEQDPPYFRERCWGFVVTNQKKIVVKISHPQGSFTFKKSKRNGHFRGILDLQLEQLPTNLSTTAHGSLKTIINAKRDDIQNEVSGEIHLIGERGISIISDIDDTIKDTNVENKRLMLENSFLKPFRSIEGMAELFTEISNPDTSFHYISATPWQLYKPIAGFLKEHHFPEGSIHLRKFALKDITFLKKIFPVHKKKRNVIEKLMKHFPSRRFLFFGDSGEKDPEIYGEIYRKYPNQILGICIRNTQTGLDQKARFRKAFGRLPKNRLFIYEQTESLKQRLLPEIEASFSLDRKK